MNAKYREAREQAYEYALRILTASQPQNAKALKPVIRQSFETGVNPDRDEDQDAGICVGIHLAVYAYSTNRMHLGLEVVVALATVDAPANRK